MKTCFEVICEASFTISLKNFGVCNEKIKIRFETPHVDGPLKKTLRHQIEVDNNP